MTGLVVTSVVVGVIIALSGVLVVWVANRAADGRLGMNSWAGVRTKATQSSPEAWSIGNRVARPSTVNGGWLLVMGGLVSAVFPTVFVGGDSDQFAAVWAGTVLLFSGPAVGMILYGTWLGNRAALDYIEMTDD